MNFLKLASCFFFTAIPAVAAPSKPVSMPAEIKATLPTGATSFLSQQLPLGPGNTKVLVHIWGATRPNTPDSFNTYNRFTASPFCVDVFELASKGWRLVSSAAYIATDPPAAVKAHWLQSGKKQGPVLEIIYGNGAPGISTQHTFLTWPNGFQTGMLPPSPQTFSSGGAGGGMLTLSFNTDERGWMTIQAIDSYVGKVKSTTIYRWDGRGFSQRRG